jgi:SAM-dependent methyltransferase
MVDRDIASVTKSPNATRIGGGKWISDTEARQIRAIPHYRDTEEAGQCGGADIQTTFGWYNTHFVDQILKFRPDPNIRSIADIGTGYGWLAIAFALTTRPRIRIIAVEYDERKLAAARQIAEIFGVAQRIQWCAGSIGRLPFGNQEIDITFCVEVIEHIRDDVEVMRDLARITKQFLVVTTPNKTFPIIHHDTSLPCCHWLPPGRLRDWYAGAFGRRDRQENNRFWSPNKLLTAVPEFERISTFLQFRNFRDYVEAQHRLYSGTGEPGGLTKMFRQIYYQGAGWAGKRSIYFLPNLASTFRRRPHTVSI